MSLFSWNCKVCHLRLKMAKNHIFVTGEYINKVASLHCERHKEQFIFLCTQCDAKVCRLCAVKLHNGHEMADLFEFTEQLLKEVNEKREIKMTYLQCTKTNLKIILISSIVKLNLLLILSLMIKIIFKVLLSEKLMPS